MGRKGRVKRGRGDRKDRSYCRQSWKRKKEVGKKEGGLEDVEEEVK